MIKDFTTNYDTIDGNKAKGVVQRMINLENKTLSLRQDYWAKFMKALGAGAPQKFCQVNNLLSLILSVQLTASISVIQNFTNLQCAVIFASIAFVAVLALSEK